VAPPFLTYQYVRIMATKKRTADPSTSMSHTQIWVKIYLRHPSF